MKDSRGSALVACYLLVAVAMVYSSVAVARGLWDQNVARGFRDQAVAFQWAEAGIDDGIGQLRSDYNWAGPVTGTAANSGTYEATVSADGTRRIIRSIGRATGNTNIATQVEAVLQKAIPPNFYDNAIYNSGDVQLKGNAYVVVGDVRTGDQSVDNAGNVQGDVIYDASASPLPRFDFAQLYALAQSQNNVYDEDRLEAIKKKQDAFPTEFCYSPPTDPDDPSTCMPNINYVTEDLVLNGDIGTVGGFFVVVGNVLTNPTATEDTTINGVGMIDGAIYTTGDFVINGGGNGLNVYGGIWAGDVVRLNGGATIEYEAAYLSAIEHLGLSAEVQLVSWRECSPTGC